MQSFLGSINKYFFALLLGGLLSASLPPYNFTLVSFLIFPLFLYLLFINKDGPAKSIFSIGFLFGYGYFLSNLYWVSYSLNFDNSLTILKPLTLLFIPSILAIFYGVACVLVKKFISDKFYFVIFFSLVLSSFDFLRGILFSGFPWNLFAYTWSWSVESIQILSFVGTYSLNFFSIIIFCLPYLLIHKPNYKRLFIVVVFVFSVLSLNFYFGENLIKKDNLNIVPNFKVVLLQPDQNINDLSNEDNETKYVDKLINESNPKIYKNQETLFVWPEGVFSNSANLRQYEDLFAKNFFENQKIVLGSTKYEKNGFFNSLLLLNNKAKIISSYDKIKLVPFGEFVPFYSFFEMIGLKKITFGYGSFSNGSSRTPISINKEITFLPLICYEIIFSGLLDLQKIDYDFILNISEDGWFGKSAGTVQHFVHSQYRAIEQGKHVIRSSNQGITASIKPNGIIDKSTGFLKNSTIAVDIYKKNTKTLFSIYENKIFYLLTFLCSVFLLFFRNKNE